MREYSSKEQKKFKQFRTIIFKELKENGRTIAELQKKFPKKSFDHDPEMKNTLFKKRWCQLQSIEKVICEKLEINYDDYGKRRSHNRIRSRIANEITEIRRVGKIIDLKFGSKLGVWRKTDPMEEKAIVEFKNKNYSFSSDEQSYKKIKEKQFKNFVQDQYKKCLLCRNSKNLESIHIIPWEIMRDIDPDNYLNPSNGLLLCPSCKFCFNKKIIQINDNHTIEMNSKILIIPDDISKHIIKISNFQKIYTNQFKPEKKYLRLKKYFIEI